jgi:hypothetical protein
MMRRLCAAQDADGESLTTFLPVAKGDDITARSAYLATLIAGRAIHEANSEQDRMRPWQHWQELPVTLRCLLISTNQQRLVRSRPLSTRYWNKSKMQLTVEPRD